MEGRENLRDKEAEVPWLDASSRSTTNLWFINGYDVLHAGYGSI
jgi:hypothetical protein